MKSTPLLRDVPELRGGCCVVLLVEQSSGHSDTATHHLLIKSMGGGRGRGRTFILKTPPQDPKNHQKRT